MLPREYSAENCSIARTLEILGDRWTALILRSALVGNRRFEDFLRRHDIARNVLADRLARLTDEGILEKRPYQERPLRHEYRVTQKGLDLWPVLIAMVGWGDKYYAPNGPPRVMEHDGCGGELVQTLTCSACGESVRTDQVSTRPGPGARQPAA